MHWLDELPGSLPEPMRAALRGFPDINAAWSACPNGPWLVRLGMAATHDPIARSEIAEVAMELSHDVAAAMAELAAGENAQEDPVLLAHDYVVVELVAAAEGRPPEVTPHRVRARPMQAFDAKVSELHKKLASQIRARFASPP